LTVATPKLQTVILSVKNAALPIKILIIAISSIAIFFQDLVVIGRDAFASDYFNYILIVPFFSLYLVYRKRRVLSAVIGFNDEKLAGLSNLIIGSCALVISLVLYLYGAYTTFPLDYHLIALQIFLGASTLMLFNKQALKYLIPPILLISSTLPSAAQFGVSFWSQLSYSSTYPAYLFLHAMGVNVVYTTISTAPAIQLTTASGLVIPFVVGVASSGAYSVVGFTLFAAFVAYIAKGSMLRRIALFSLGYILLLPVNTLRLVIIIIATNSFGESTFPAFHFSSGIVLVFGVTLALLALGERYFKLSFFPQSKIRPQCSYCAQTSAASSFCLNCGRFLRLPRIKFGRISATSLGILLLVVLIFLSSLEPAVAAANGPNQIGSVNLTQLNSQNVLTFLPHIPGWNISFVARDTQIEEILQQDAALIYLYSQNKTDFLNASIPQIYATVQISATIHTPEGSLITHPLLTGYPTATVYEDKDLQILNNPPLVGKMFIYDRVGSNLTEADFYWNIRSYFNFGSYSDFRNVQIGLWGYTESLASAGLIPNATDYAGIANLYVPLAREIADYWAPQTTNSLLGLGIKNWFWPIFIAAVIPATFVEGYTLDETNRAKKSSAKFYVRLTNETDRELIQAVSSCSAKYPTLEEILKNYSRLTNKQINPIDASVALNYAEKAGLVHGCIMEMDGEPISVWKSSIKVSESKSR